MKAHSADNLINYWLNQYETGQTHLDSRGLCTHFTDRWEEAGGGGGGAGGFPQS